MNPEADFHQDPAEHFILLILSKYLTRLSLIKHRPYFLLLNHNNILLKVPVYSFDLTLVWKRVTVFLLFYIYLLSHPLKNTIHLKTPE